MGDVYANGEQTVIWLGLGSEPFQRAIRWVKGVDWTDYDSYDSKAVATFMRRLSTSTMDHLEALCFHHYWNRAWIVQEVVKSRHIELWSGVETLKSDELSQIGLTVGDIDAFFSPQTRLVSGKSVVQSRVMKVTFSLLRESVWYQTMLFFHWGQIDGAQHSVASNDT